MLTSREKSILTLIGSGKTTKEIASSLELSPFTIADYRKHISRKLSLHSTAELIAYALRNEPLAPEGDGGRLSLQVTAAPLALEVSRGDLF